MHSLSDIYATINPITVGMWVAVLLLISGIYNKKNSLSVISIVLLVFVGYKMKGHLNTQSVSIYGANLMLVSLLAYLSNGIKNKAAIAAYTVLASITFFVLHSYISLNPNIHISVANYNDNKYPQLDTDAELLVKFKNQKELIAWIDKYDSKYQITYPAFTPNDKSYNLDEYLIVNLKANENSQQKIKEIEKLPFVNYVEGNEILELKLPAIKTENSYSNSQSSQDPYSGKQWMADEFDLEKFHKNISQISYNAEPRSCTIAILDTGVDGQHEDLTDNYMSTSSSYDTDKRGHGTHCAGIAAAVTGNHIGISSWIPRGMPIKVTSIKVLTSSGIGSQRTIINGIIEATDNGYEIISLSLGGRSNPEREQAYKDAVKYANDKGSIVIVAAGNSAQDAIRYSPANTPGVIAVAAIDSKMQLAEFSNIVENITYGIAAPGADIFSTLPNHKYGTNSGTSMAAPFVSGVVSIMKYYNPQLTTREIYGYLKKSALKKKGQTIINPQGAFELMMQDVPVE